MSNGKRAAQNQSPFKYENVHFVLKFDDGIQFVVRCKNVLSGFSPN